MLCTNFRVPYTFSVRDRLSFQRARELLIQSLPPFPSPFLFHPIPSYPVMETPSRSGTVTETLWCRRQQDDSSPIPLSLNHAPGARGGSTGNSAANAGRKTPRREVQVRSLSSLVISLATHYRPLLLHRNFLPCISAPSHIG